MKHGKFLPCGKRIPLTLPSPTERGDHEVVGEEIPLSVEQRLFITSNPANPPHTFNRNDFKKLGGLEPFFKRIPRKQKT